MGTLNYDTFPRSGTHTLGLMLDLAFPNYKKFWGQHNPKTLNSPNAITVIRHYKDAISSLCSLDTKLNVEKTIDVYCYFYETINQFDIYYCSLTALTQKPNEIMFDYAQKYNLDKPCFVDIHEYQKQMLNKYPDCYPRQTLDTKTAVLNRIENTDLSKIELLWQELSDKCVI